jgi:hypothetical protein
MSEVTFDSRAVRIDGRRALILSGAIHYPRSTPAVWPDLLRRSREAGLNTIETYVFWNLHERRRGVLDFSERLDLPRFCRLAQEAGLRVILRIGPYICAETNYGGFPPWLRDVPGIAMRTYNEPFMSEMARWVRTLCQVLRDAFAPRGGPIILAQIENEYNNVAKQYGEQGRRYLQWAADLGGSLGLGIPWVLCAGGAEGAIETINGHFPHEGLADHFQRHPDQPALCTELWPGWYDAWGAARAWRPPESTAYATARFIAGGATGVNYYMWHAGTNFGRESMYLQPPHYGFQGGLDEFGLENTQWGHLGRLHRALAASADAILASDRPQAQPLGPKQAAFAYGSGADALVFLANDDPACAAEVAHAGKTYALAPRSVVLVRGGRVVADTGRVDPADVVRRSMRPSRTRLAPFARWAEPLPADRPADMPGTVVARKPVEQLALTHDESDYCWYDATLTVGGRKAVEGTLLVERAGDVLHVFVDGRLRATTPTPLVEDRGPVDGAGYRQEFRLTLAPGRHDLQVLSCALGLVKGDWSLGHRNMVEERKGLWGPVRWDGKALGGPWRMRPGLVGEHAGLAAGGGILAPWKAAKRGRGRPLTWYRATFPAPKGRAPVALDLGSMGKGLAWVNGRCLGRYWLAPIGDPRQEWLGWLMTDPGLGEPTQRYYHVPREWLGEANTLVLFEELGGDPAGVRLAEWR